MLIEDARRQVSEACSHFIADGLTVGTAGNISLRDGDLLAITPSGLPYRDMRPDLVCVIDVESGEQVEGPLKPTSEIGLHRMALRLTGQGAAIHTHSRAAAALASIEGITALPAMHYLIGLFGGTDVRVAEFGTYGSAELTANVEKALDGRLAALMANHGAIVTGKDLDHAYTLATELEWSCDVYLRMLSAGTPKLLSIEELETVTQKIHDTHYGQKAPEQA